MAVRCCAGGHHQIQFCIHTQFFWYYRQQFAPLQLLSLLLCHLYIERDYKGQQSPMNLAILPAPRQFGQLGQVRTEPVRFSPF